MYRRKEPYFTFAGCASTQHLGRCNNRFFAFQGFRKEFETELRLVYYGLDLEISEGCCALMVFVNGKATPKVVLYAERWSEEQGHS